MTPEQVKRIKEQVQFAKTITDEKQKAEAFELIAQQRDEMMLDCFSKQSERIKNVIKQNEQFEHDIHNIKEDLVDIKKNLKDNVQAITTDLETNVTSLKTDLKPLTIMYNDYIKRKAERNGMYKLMKFLKVAGVTLGSAGSTGLILKLLEIF